MAVGAHPRRNSVHAREGESGRIVVKRRIRPGNGVVTLIAGLREAGGHVIGIRGSLVILQVTGNAGRAREVVVVVDVAIRTLTRRYGMATRQRESHGIVIEVGCKPAVRAVAGAARGREVCRDVIRICGRFEIRGVARIALCRQRNELAASSSLVAGITVDGRMRSGQRKAVIVLLDLRD